MVERRWRLHDAVPEPQVAGALRDRRQEHLRCARVGVLLEEMVLDLPDVLDPQRVGAARTARARSGAAGTRSRRSTAAGAGARRTVRTAPGQDSATPSRPSRLRSTRRASRSVRAADGSGQGGNRREPTSVAANARCGRPGRRARPPSCRSRCRPVSTRPVPFMLSACNGSMTTGCRSSMGHRGSGGGEVGRRVQACPERGWDGTRARASTSASCSTVITARSEVIATAS